MSTSTTAQVAIDPNEIKEVSNKESIERRELKALFKLIDKKENCDFSIQELQHIFDSAGLKDCKFSNDSCTKPGKLVEELKKIREFVSDNEDLSATFVLRRASQGVLLTGTSLAEYPDLHKRKYPLIQLNCSVSLQKPSLKPFVCDREFYSKRLCEEFERNTDILGITAATFLADSEKNKMNDIDSNDFYCRIIWLVVPYALWQPTYENFSFSNQALKGLVDIENLLKENNESIEANTNKIKEAKTKCEHFFLQFGSHISFENVHLGGVFKFKAVSVGSSLNDRLKTRVQNILSCNIKDAFIFDYECRTKDGTEELNGDNKSLDDTGEKVQIHVSQIGGPTEVSCFPLWRRATAAYNRSWAVIDRGKHDLLKYVGIWALVQNQSMAFNDHASLSRVLSETWLQLENGKFKSCSNVLAIEKCFQNHLKDLSNTSADIFRKVKVLADTLQQHERTLGTSYLKDRRYHDYKGFINIMNIIPTLEFSQNDLIELRENVINLLRLCRGDNMFIPRNQNLHSWLRRTEMAHKGLLESKKFESIEEFLNELDSHFMKSVRLVSVYPVQETQSKHKLSRSIDCELSGVFMNLFDVLAKRHKYDEFIMLLSLAVLLDFDTENAELGAFPNKESLEDFLRNAKQRLAIFQRLEIKYRIPWGVKNIITSIMKTKGEKFEHLVKYNKILKFLSKYHITQKLEIDIFPNELKNIDDILIAMNDIIPIWWKDLPQKSYSPTSKKQNSLSAARTFTHKPLCDLLKMIGMVSYFPENLSIARALLLSDNMFSDPKEMKDVPFVIIRRITCINYTFREKVLEEFLQKSQTTDRNIQQSKTMPSIVRSRRYTTNYPNCHPLDVILAIFMCCDPFLKRVLAKKISICQMSLPIIYNDHMREGLVFSLWPLRDIYLDGESESVATQALKTISFIRIGDKPLKSKSKLINKFLRDQNVHDTFFHCDCALGQQKRTISEGLVEMSWYVPNIKDCGISIQGKNSENLHTINMPLTVFNLRGDASSFETQLELLLLMSNIVVILITFEGMSNKRYMPLLSKIHRSKVNVVFLTNLPDDDKELCSFYEFYSETTKMDDSKTAIISTSEMGTDLNESQIRQYLIKEIASTLTHSDDGFVLENVQMAIPSHIKIHIDEDNIKCMKAKEIFECIDLEKELPAHLYKRTALKDKLLPLQGESFWQEWSKKKKEYSRSINMETNILNDPRRKAMKICRIMQVDICNGASPVIVKFATNLVENINDERLIKYFIFWIGEFLDKRSKTILPLLRQKYDEAFSRYESSRLKMKEDLSSYMQAKQDIASAEKNISQASFGIEHLFREIGQVYEAFLDCAVDKKANVAPVTLQFLQILPKAVAKLLLMGQPLEIMDGDAADIPQRWIQSVFSELSDLLGKEKKVFTISVVGIQSSGKSTLLNTMFGLQFAVSAGRCTKGLFLQIIPIDKQQSSLQFDYVMVIDTEGLRAPEKIDQRIAHDNELATLAIGLGDVAIVNIKGEVFADMEDILQVVVHAIVRLKHAKGLTYHQASVFVHQNVSSSEASSLTSHGKFKLVQNLDEKTQIVAEEENMANITSFCDVIEFDSSKHVKYICDLWQGSPPGAPVNPLYSKDVMNVAHVILNSIAKETSTFLTISETEMHIRNIWDGILSDDFVFSFRNTLEIKAFSSLEEKYQKLVLQLNEFKLHWLTIQIFPKFAECKTKGDIDICDLKMRSAFDDEFEKLAKCLRRDLEEFVDKSDVKEHMVHWKDRKLYDINLTSRVVKNEAHTHIETEKQHCIDHMEKRNLLWENKKKITKQAVDFANEFLGKSATPTTEEIDKSFEDLWTNLLDKYAPEIKEAQEEKIARDGLLKNEMKHILSEFFMKHQKLLDEGLLVDIDDKRYNIKQLKHSFTLEDIQEDHVNTLSMKKLIENGFRKGVIDFFSDHRKQALSVIDDIFTRADKMLKEFLQCGDAYDRTHFIKLLKDVMKRVDEHNKDSTQHGYTLTPKFQIHISLHISRYAFEIFQIMNEKNKKKKSLRTLLNSDKDEIKTLFVGVCLAKAQEVLATDLICSGLRHEIKRKITKILSVIIPEIIQHVFRWSKGQLIGAIIRDLIEKESFEDIVGYLRNSEMYAYIWILEFMKKFFSDEDENSESYKHFVVFLEGVISDRVEKVRDALQYVAKRRPSSNESWVKYFFERYGGTSLAFESFLSLNDLSCDELLEMQANIEKQLCDIKSEMIKFIKDLPFEEIEWEDTSPFIETFNGLWRCKEACPFCEEPCLKSYLNHNHECLYHRPSGIIGVSLEMSNKLVCETCEFDIQSLKTRSCGVWCGCSKQDCEMQHPFKEFKNIMPKWDIRPSKNPSGSRYWAWIMTKYRCELAQYYNKVEPDIPEAWFSISKTEALQALDDYMFYFRFD